MGNTINIDITKLEKGCLPFTILECNKNTLKHDIMCQLHKNILMNSVSDHKGHNFCGTCLYSYTKQAEICPYYKKHRLKVDQLKPNKQLDNYILTLPASC